MTELATTQQDPAVVHEQLTAVAGELINNRTVLLGNITKQKQQIDAGMLQLDRFDVLIATLQVAMTDSDTQTRILEQLSMNLAAQSAPAAQADGAPLPGAPAAGDPNAPAAAPQAPAAAVAAAPPAADAAAPAGSAPAGA